METSYMGNDITGFVFGEGEDSDEDFYGMTVSRDLDVATVTGKVYQRRGADETTIIAGAVSGLGVAENVTLGGEVAYDYENEGTYATANAAVNATDELTVTGTVENVTEDFVSYDKDLEEDNQYLLGKVGAEYMLDDMNTLSGAFVFVDADEDVNKMRVEAGIENLYNDFTNTANVEYTMNSGYVEDDTNLLVEVGTVFDMDAKTNLTADFEYEDDSTFDEESILLAVGADYMWNETTTFGAAYQYKNTETGLNYNYLEGTVSKALYENVSWDTTAKYLMGETEAGDEGEGSTINTALTVTF
jgi:hypothetical protein